MSGRAGSSGAVDPLGYEDPTDLAALSSLLMLGDPGEGEGAGCSPAGSLPAGVPRLWWAICRLSGALPRPGLLRRRVPFRDPAGGPEDREEAPPGQLGGQARPRRQAAWVPEAEARQVSHRGLSW